MTLFRRVPSSLFLLMVLVSAAAAQQTFHVGDRVNAGFMGSSYSYKDGTVIAVGNGKYKVHFDGYPASYDDWVPAARVKKSAQEESVATPAAPSATGTDIHVGDRVNAGFMGSSYSFKDGTVIGTRRDGYKIHFDGYADSYDEWVPAARVKKIAPKAAAPQANTTRTTTAQSAGGSEPDCRVGMHLARAGLLNREATITAIDTRQGLYKVKYDNGDLDEYLPAKFLHGCRGVGPAAITISYFTGKWALFAGPTPHYEDRGSDRYLVVGPGGKAPPLEINGDGSYVWTIDSRTQVRGRWREMQPGEFSMSTRAPAIVLLKGEDGKDWGVWRPDAVGMADTRDRIEIKRMDMGLTYQGSRLR